MDTESLRDMVDGFKNKKNGFKKQVIEKTRDALGMTRPQFMSLSLQDATQLMTALLTSDEVKELTGRSEFIQLKDIMSKSERKERRDKGVPRKRPVEVEDVQVDDDTAQDAVA